MRWSLILPVHSTWYVYGSIRTGLIDNGHVSLGILPFPPEKRTLSMDSLCRKENAHPGHEYQTRCVKRTICKHWWGISKVSFPLNESKKMNYFYDFF